MYSYFLMFINNLINYTSKHKKKLYYLYCRGSITVVYNMYNMYMSTSFRGLNLYMTIVVYILYIYKYIVILNTIYTYIDCK